MNERRPDLINDLMRSQPPLQAGEDGYSASLQVRAVQAGEAIPTSDEIIQLAHAWYVGSNVGVRRRSYDAFVKSVRTLRSTISERDDYISKLSQFLAESAEEISQQAAEIERLTKALEDSEPTPDTGEQK